MYIASQEKGKHLITLPLCACARGNNRHFWGHGMQCTKSTDIVDKTISGVTGH